MVPAPQRYLGSTVEFLVTAGTSEQCIHKSDCRTVRRVGCSPTLNASALPFVVSAAASVEVHSWTVREALAGYFPLFGVFWMT